MPPKKLGLLSKSMLMLFAISIDGAQALFSVLYFFQIPIIGQIITILTFLLCSALSLFATIILAAWFYYLDVKFMGRLPIAAVAEFIPFISTLPSFTIATSLTILAAEHKTIGMALGAAGVTAGSYDDEGEENSKPPKNKPQMPASNTSVSTVGGAATASKSPERRESSVLKNPQYQSANNKPAQAPRSNPPSDGLLVERNTGAVRKTA